MSASTLHELPVARPTDPSQWGLHSCLLRSERIQWRRVDDAAVLLDPDTSRCTSVNVVGAIIWDRCDGTLSVEEIIDEIAQEFAVDRIQVHDDVVRFVGELVARGFLV